MLLFFFLSAFVSLALLYAIPVFSYSAFVSIAAIFCPMKMIVKITS